MKKQPAVLQSQFNVRGFDQAIGLTSRAGDGNWSCGRPPVLGVRLDRFHDQVEFVGAVDLSEHAIVLVWCDDQGAREVIQAVDPAGGLVEHEEDHAGAVFHPLGQKQMVGAEVEHGRRKWNGGGTHPRPIGSAVEGFTRRTPPVRAIAQSGA